MKRALLVLMLGSLLLVASVAHAAGPKSAYSPTLKVTFAAQASTTGDGSTPDPYVVSGCGYDSSFGGVTIVVHSPVAISFAGQIPDGDGCIAVTNFSTQGPGHYDVDAFQTIHRKSKVVASTGFDV
jgi:hypothetical protein